MPFEFYAKKDPKGGQIYGEWEGISGLYPKDSQVYFGGHKIEGIVDPIAFFHNCSPTHLMSFVAPVPGLAHIVQKTPQLGEDPNAIAKKILKEV